MAKTEDLKRTVLRLPHDLYEAVVIRAGDERIAINSMLVRYIEKALEDERIQAEWEEMEFDRMIEEEYVTPEHDELLTLADPSCSNFEKGRIAKRLLLEGLIKAADDEQMGRVFDVLVSMFNDYNYRGK